MCVCACVAVFASPQEACKQKVVDIKRMRGEMQAMAGDIRDKERRVTELEEQLEKMPKNLNRSVCVGHVLRGIMCVRMDSSLTRRPATQIHVPHHGHHQTAAEAEGGDLQGHH